MKYVIVFVILNLACKFTEAQELNFQLYFRPGLSKMNDQRHHLNPDKFQIKYQPCYDIGIRINNRFSNLEAIGVAGSIITVNSNENMMYYNPDFKLHTYSKLKYRLSYFSVNIYNSVSIKRINCNLGMSALVLLKSKGNLSGYMVDSIGKIFNKVSNVNQSALPLKSYNLCGNFGIDYSLSDKFKLSAEYCIGFTDIFNESFNWEWHTRNYLIGLKYELIRINFNKY